MGLLTFLKREGYGDWESIDDYRADLMKRSGTALGGLAAVAQGETGALRELTTPDGGELMQSVARDARVQRGARLAALKASLEADPSPIALGKLFARAGDLLGDPRLGPADQGRLARQGMEAFLTTTPPQAVTVEVGAFARSVRNARDVLGEEAVRSLLARGAGGAENLPGQTARWIAFGEAPSELLRTRWMQSLEKQHKAWKAAPAAAKRLGTAPAWPPTDLPDEFKPWVKEVEEGKIPVGAPGAPASGTAPAKLGSPLPLPGSDNITGVRQSTGSETDPPHAAALVGEGAAASAPPPAPRGPPLKSLRFGEQIEQLLKGRPEGVERLLAAMDVRASLHGAERAAQELERAAKAAAAPPPAEMLDRLRKVAADAEAPAAWRTAAEAALRGFGTA